MTMETRVLLNTLRSAIAAALADTHTATIARVTAVGATTINCRPVINRVVNGESIALPEFVDVPPLFLQGGGRYTAHPIAVGDYCLLIFTERCFDRWYAGQDYQPPLELRMHDYSDAIAIAGVNPLAGAIPIPSTIKQVGDTTQIGDYTHSGNMTRTGTLDQTGDASITGDVDVDGNVTATGNVSATSFSGPSGGTMNASGAINATGFQVGGTPGASGTFTTVDGKTVTVTNGLITSIV